MADGSAQTVAAESAIALRITVRGRVQGVGYRPFVVRTAHRLGLSGQVANTSQGVRIEVEGSADAVALLCDALTRECPPQAEPTDIACEAIAATGRLGFRVVESESGAGAEVSPDLAICPECVGELLDPTNRRYRHAFIGCTACGPRYSMMRSMPYDRARTTMSGFEPCAACRAEYDDPGDRRFHCQHICCPGCGPQLRLCDSAGEVLHRRDAAVAAAVECLVRGGIVAMKGIGGYLLTVDARNGEAVARLRRLKRRDAKPLAVMYADADAVRRDCEATETESRVLESTAAPIVLLRRRPDAAVAREVGDNPYLGAMAACSGLHRLIALGVGGPVVATSGNLSDEPICIDDVSALARLGSIADRFLVHDRPIARSMDDSVVRVIDGAPTVLRCGRGYSPVRLALGRAVRRVTAFGGHLKSAAATAAGDAIRLDRHIGDLNSAAARDALADAGATLGAMFDPRPTIAVVDRHDGYGSTEVGRRAAPTVIRVQHHHAHVLSCLADNGAEPPVLGVAWDGTGAGDDGTIWGGEFLVVDGAGFTRAAHLRTFALPGGESAVREPRRSALGLLFEMYGRSLRDRGGRCGAFLAAAFAPTELDVLMRMLSGGVNCPRTSSAGRLFDAVAAITGTRERASYEGQAAMALEFAAEGEPPGEPYPFAIDDDGSIDWGPMIEAILEEIDVGQSGMSVPPDAGRIASRFHDALAEWIVTAARRVGLPRVALSGGCFANAVLTARAASRLRSAGFEVLRHRRVPPNDGGLAVGQALLGSLTSEV